MFTVYSIFAFILDSYFVAKGTASLEFLRTNALIFEPCEILADIPMAFVLFRLSKKTLRLIPAASR